MDGQWVGARQVALSLRPLVMIFDCPYTMKFSLASYFFSSTDVNVEFLASFDYVTLLNCVDSLISSMLS